MKSRRFIQCDVFSPVPTQGNGLAVVIDAQGMSDEQMQQFAAWTNLAETTFLLPPTDPKADYQVRIFTPIREMLFAGHPTLGSCASWLHAGGRPQSKKIVRQQCKIGIVEVDISESPTLAFAAPATTIAPLSREKHDLIVRALDIDPKTIVRTSELCNGPVWQVLELDSIEAVMKADSSRVRWAEHKAIGLIARHPQGSECDYEVRMLAPSSGMSEDPITGSLNAAVAQWMLAEGRLTKPYIAAQGTAINRKGRVSVKSDANSQVWIGGQVHILIEGTLAL